MTHYELKQQARRALAAGALDAATLNALPRAERREHLAGMDDEALYAQACVVALHERLGGPVAAMARWEWERVVDWGRLDRLRDGAPRVAA